jgi:hypothetical protein
LAEKRKPLSHELLEKPVNRLPPRRFPNLGFPSSSTSPGVVMLYVHRDAGHGLSAFSGIEGKVFKEFFVSEARFGRVIFGG